MTQYTKRIAFCIADSHLIAHGGIGQFAKGFIQMASRLHWKVDLIVDKPTNSPFANHLRELGAGLIAPSSPLSYSKHSAIFAFGDGVNFEKVVNFRDALMQAFTHNLYDMIVCNTLESMPAAQSLDLHKWVQVVFYTHNESMVFKASRLKNTSPFVDSANEFFDRMLGCDGVYIGTQTLRNQAELANTHQRVELLPMPMTELDLLLPSTEEEKDGVLFIGRWEEGKNPLLYLDIVKESGLKPKVMTSKNSARKFVEWFERNGIQNHDVRSGIVGEEKVQFIKGAKYHVNVSRRESFGFALWECLGHMQCFVDGECEWVKNFSAHPNLIAMPPKAKVADWVKAIQQCNHRVNGAGLVRVLRENKLAESLWADSLKRFVERIKPNTRNQAKINEFEVVKYRDYIEGLGRSGIAIDDLKSVLSNRSKFITIYTDTDTWLSKDENFIPPTDTQDNPTSIELLFK